MSINEAASLAVDYRAAAVSDAVWDAFVAGHATPHILQSSGWAALKARFGWEATRVTLVDATGAVQAGAVLLFRRAAGLTIAYVPRGPLTDWANPVLTRRLLAELEARSRTQGAALLKLEPELADTPQNRALLASYGFQPSAQSIQPPSTILLDLTGSDDDILQRMKSKWRYNVRLAERKDVTVRALARNELAHFNALMATTGARDGFAVHEAEYYAAAYDLLVHQDRDDSGNEDGNGHGDRHGVFLLAEHAGVPLAAIAVFAMGDMAWYLWGASSNLERNRMPNHALQWAAMQWAKAHGATRYDFWGIPDELGKLSLALAADSPDDPSSAGLLCGAAADALPLDLNRLPGEGLWGVYRFKQGFGGAIVRTVGAWDKPLHAAGFHAYRLGLTLLKQPARLRQLDPVQAGLTVAGRRPPVRNSTLRPVEEAGQWRNLLAALPDPHVLQSWEWGEVKAQTGWQAERLIVPGAKGAAEAALQFLWQQPVDGAPLRIGYVPKGPVLDWNDPARVERVLTQIEAHAHARNCLFVKIDPDVRADSSAGRRLVHTLFRRGWRYSADQIQFKNSAYSDLTQNEEALLAGMKSKWRYNIRLAAKRGITVRAGIAADLPAFYDLYAETSARDGFLIRPFDYYRTAWTTFLDAEQAEANPAGGVLLLAEHADDQHPVAGLFLMRYGARSWYFYGASSERHRRDMPNHLLQWEALRWSRSRGCAIYDWWGAPTEIDDPDDAMQGVWQFKQGFGAEFQPHIGAWDYAVSPALYRAYSRAVPAVLAYLRRATA